MMLCWIESALPSGSIYVFSVNDFSFVLLSFRELLSSLFLFNIYAILLFVSGLKFSGRSPCNASSYIYLYDIAVAFILDRIFDRASAALSKPVSVGLEIRVD